MNLNCMCVAFLGTPKGFGARGKEALEGRRSFGEHREEGIVILLYMQLQEVGGGQGLFADGAAVPRRENCWSDMWVDLTCGQHCSGFPTRGAD